MLKINYMKLLKTLYLKAPVLKVSSIDSFIVEEKIQIITLLFKIKFRLFYGKSWI